MTAFRQLLRSDRAAGSAEFALVLPLYLLLLFGVIDAGRFAWEYNKAEKATQVGARVAVVTDVLSAGLRDEDYAGDTVDGVTLASGDRIPAGALGTLLCKSTGCSCAAAPCPAVGTFNTTTFNDTLVARMKQIYPAVEAENVEVRYSGSGFGFAAEDTGGGGGVTESMEISPLVTVTLNGVSFNPIMLGGLGKFPLPDISTTLTAEDASGAYSN
jgi:hypothetical protein